MFTILRHYNNKKRDLNGQSIVEFTVCFILLLLIIYGCIMLLRWVGVNFAERRIAHDETLTVCGPGQDCEDWESLGDSPTRGLDTEFYRTTELNLVFNRW